MSIIGRTTSPVICRKCSMHAVLKGLCPAAFRDIGGSEWNEPPDAKNVIMN